MINLGDKYVLSWSWAEGKFIQLLWHWHKACVCVFFNWSPWILMGKANVFFTFLPTFEETSKELVALYKAIMACVVFESGRANYSISNFHFACCCFALHDLILCISGNKCNTKYQIHHAFSAVSSEKEPESTPKETDQAYYKTDYTLAVGKSWHKPKSQRVYARSHGTSHDIIRPETEDRCPSQGRHYIRLLEILPNISKKDWIRPRFVPNDKLSRVRTRNHDFRSFESWSNSS